MLHLIICFFAVFSTAASLERMPFGCGVNCYNDFVDCIKNERVCSFSSCPCFDRQAACYMRCNKQHLPQSDISTSVENGQVDDAELFD